MLFGGRIVPTVLYIEALMKDQPIEGFFHGKKVWAHLSMDQLRKSECLCLNCANLKPGEPDNCSIAQSFFEICVRENVALAVTRCPLWKSKLSLGK